MSLENLVEGWTQPISETLLTNGSPTNLTGATVALLLYDRVNTPVNYQGTTSVSNAVGGVVAFNPVATDLIAASSPYSIRWKVTDGSGKVFYFPNNAPGIWHVGKP